MPNTTTKTNQNEIATLRAEIAAHEAALLNAPAGTDPEVIQEIAQDIVNATHEIQDIEYRMMMGHRPERVF